ncbi:MFS transporter [Allofrancisella guangzhouensis]|uniref:Lysosomal dipeptide transporter MFSD1 n=1 Tax=Allofrancisella guangzhouensis TaxID=594679 RepID=A0A0A8E340_9GAMM|nr:MFS transporter [Allofrancisella guangzhouensis]AJC48605.1 MFS transporter [Allofrancisella guangzhouensis]MBK2027957.1 MFS transporter [Allofrancisella guangzhouensis]MBK2043679.1 MFS transporter [Allofrancisella guangzhouensis]MBK2046264.1 MFS transporter [Allofrancisella guangzhouensis]
MQKFRTLIILTIGISFYCYEFFLRILTGAYQEQIVNYFNISTHIGFSFLISSYNITYLIMQIPAGILLDRFGSKRVLIAATLVCGAGNILFIAGGFNTAIVGRLLVGVGSSFAFIGVLKLALENFNPKYFSFITSIIISLGTLAAAFSQNVSVLISNYNTSWIDVFIYSGIFALPLAVLFQIFSPKEVQTVNLMPKFKQIYDASKNLIKNKKLWINATWAGLIYIPTIVLTSQYGILYFKQTYGFSDIFATTLITLIFMGWAIFSPIKTLLANKFDPTRVINISVLGTVIIIIIINFGILKNYAVFLVFIFGAFSASQVLVWHYFNKISHQNFTAIGIAITNMLITLVTEVGQLIVGLSIDTGNAINLASKTSISICFVIFLILGAIFFKKIKINNKSTP